MSVISRIPLPIRCFFAADLAVGALYVANLAAGRPWQKLNLFLDLDHEGNLPAWFSSLQWAAVAALFAYVAYEANRRKHRASTALLLLAGLFLFLSMDEASSVHERLTAGLNGKLLGDNRILMSSWLVVLGIPLAFFLWRIAIRIKDIFDEAPGSLRCTCSALLSLAPEHFSPSRCCTHWGSPGSPRDSSSSRKCSR